MIELSQLQPNFTNLAVYLFTAMILGFAAIVAFGRNIIYSAFSLLGCFTGVAAMYVLLVADFIGILQLFVYVGGITVLIIFAVMFTKNMVDVKVTNQSMHWKFVLPTLLVMFYFLSVMILNAPWKIIETRLDEPTTAFLGDLLLSEYLLPFELVSLVLLVALIGAIVVARKDKRGELIESEGGKSS